MTPLPHLLPRLLTAWTLLGAAALSMLPAQAAGGTDVRLVVEVSAEMARADPENGRGEALGMLLRTLPESGRAGVWTYGPSARTLARYAPSNALWKENAAILTAALAPAGSRQGLYDALDQASWDRAEADGGADLVLIAAGPVSGSAPDDALSRRLLNELAPQLAAAGYRVHTLTISGAPAGPLEQLSALTGGYHGTLPGAGRLPQRLLEVLDWVVPANRLKVSQHGSFRVDPGIRELTVLRLDAGPGERVVLRTPQGERLGRNTARSRVRWHLGPAYELVTVAHPAPGRWHLEGGAGEVLAYGDLHAEYIDLPGTLFPDDLRSIELQVRSGDRTVTDVAFLELTTLSATLHGARGSRPVVVEAVAPGRYQAHLVGVRKPGEYRLETRLWGPTFDYRRSLPFVVSHPLSVTVRPGESGPVLWVEVDAPDVDHRRLQLAALVAHPPAAARPMALQRQPSGLWKVGLPEADGSLEIRLDISAKSLNDKEVKIRSEAIQLLLPLTGPHRVGLDLDGRRVQMEEAPGAVAPVAAADRAPPEPAPRPAGVDFSGAPGATAPQASTELSLPVWFAVAVGLVNLGLGAAVWWLAAHRLPAPADPPTGEGEVEGAAGITA